MTDAALVKEMAAIGRRYVAALEPETFLGLYVRPRCACEHCDGERSPLVRVDALRGNVCPPCDSSLDEMFGEGTFARRRAS